MVRLDRIVTRAGDGGETTLGGGGGRVRVRRVRKDDLRVEALGDIDELSCVLGLAGLAVRAGERRLIESLQRDLFGVGADMAAPRPGRALRTTPAHVGRIDAEAVRRARLLRSLRGFVVPGGAAGAGWLHLARAVCRRAERRAVAAGTSREAVRYLNRLSDLLFLMARAAGRRPRVWEVPGRPRR